MHNSQCHFCARALTKRVDEFAECYCEAASWLVESEEQHGDILRWPCDWSRRSGFAVIGIALVERKKMVLCAGKLLALHNPAIKYLEEKNSMHCSQCTIKMIHYWSTSYKKILLQNIMFDFFGIVVVNKSILHQSSSFQFKLTVLNSF